MAGKTKASSAAAAARNLESRLTSGAIEKADLRKYAAAIGKLERYRVVDWCVLGIPVSEYVCTKFHVDGSSVPDLLRDLLVSTDLRTRIEIFPFGIPVPDFFEVSVALGDRPLGRRT